jgi:hypothetical protein
MRRTFIGLALSLSLMSMVSLAHPVSFKGSKGVMGYHSPIVTHHQLNYSFEYWLAAGVHHIRRPQLDNRFATLGSVNLLLKRWNGEALQSNLYALLGAGESQLGPTAETSGLAGIQFDIEDRDYYFLARHLHIGNERRADLNQTIVRAGVTPYVDGYDGFHSWIILEWKNSEFAAGDELSDLTPFLRFFYRNFLFEIGQSFDGISKLNYIAHF